MAGGAIAARALHFLKDRSRGGNTEARAAVFLGNERRQPAGVGQRLDELRRITALAIERAPVGTIEFQSERADGISDLGMRRLIRIFHGGAT